MKKNLYFSYDTIINDDNLLFNLKLDRTFKNVFLNYAGFNYLCLLFSIILDIDYNLLKKELKIINNEIPSGLINIRSSYSDIICEYKDISIILEMNYGNKLLHLHKNYTYLFKQHGNRLNNTNDYGRNKKTILINIDSYDVLNKNNLLYDSKLMFQKYNMCIYKNIEILHINLDYLNKKYYNKDKLNELEKILLIFIEQRKDKLEKIINRKEVEDIMDFISRLKMKDGYPVTYDRDEYEKIERELFEQEKEELANEKNKLANEKTELANEKTELKKEKIEFAKELKKIGTPLEKIIKITKLNAKQIYPL